MDASEIILLYTRCIGIVNRRRAHALGFFCLESGITDQRLLIFE